MTLRRRFFAVASALAFALGALTFGMADAQAIGRGSCTSDNHGLLWIYANSTTCWGGTGQATANLVDAVLLTPGSNTGWIASANHSPISFVDDKHGPVQYNISPMQTITVVTILSSI